MLIRALLRGAFLLSIAATGLRAQSVADLIASGDSENEARQPTQALAFYEKALAEEPRNYIALWKAARELVDLGEFDKHPEARSALYARAAEYAKRAVSVNPNDAEGHFHLARAIGRTALNLGPRDRVKLGGQVREETLRALELNPRHPGALHIMGVWNAEVMRLNGMTRLIAKTLLGGKVLDNASWAEAIRYMELSVSIEPTRLVHHLDQARIYKDVGRKEDARKAYEAAIALPLKDANDDVYKRTAEAELKKLGK